MNRRKFIRNISYGTAGSLTLGGIPVKAMQGTGLFQLAAANGDNDNVLIFVQLHGGNDALNTVIPVSQWEDYYLLRPNLAINKTGERAYKELDATLPEAMRVGLHPEFYHIKEMYDQGKVAVVNNVGYPQMNLSHFRGRDIVFMGGDAGSDYESGWMGRFLDATYPGYPDAYPTADMKDPLGIELSGTQSLAFHREDGIPVGLSFNNPQAFHNLITNTGVQEPPIVFPDSHAGDELRYIMELEKMSNKYAGRLKEVYDKGKNSSVEYNETYPRYSPNYKNNPLAGQLRLIARLLAGGIQTRVFLCRIGGFDTHGDQVVKDDSSLGIHAALLHHLSSAMKNFYDDLEQLGIDEKVLSMTFTEFGRRAKSNDSYGTDHGTATPVLLFGTGLNAGVYGENADLKDLKGNNLKYEVDYRQIYDTVVKDWFGATPNANEAVGFDESAFGTRLNLISNSSGIEKLPYTSYGFNLSVYPTVAHSTINVGFNLNKQKAVQIKIFSTEGKLLLSSGHNGFYGANKVDVDISTLPTGMYHVLVNTDNKKYSATFMKK